MTDLTTRIKEILEQQQVEVIEISVEKCEYRILGIATTAEKIMEAVGGGWNEAIEAAAQTAEAQARIDCATKAVANAIRALRRPDAAPAREMPSEAARDVLAERKRQVASEGYTTRHDDLHDHGQIAYAAASYALSSRPSGTFLADIILRLWPWPGQFKPRDPRRDLVRAGALIIAEIERLDRALLKGK